VHDPDRIGEARFDQAWRVACRRVCRTCGGDISCKRDASYLSIRWSDRVRLSVHIERLADTIFLCGLVGITLVATLFAYQVI